VGKLVIGGEVHWCSNRETGGIDAISIFLGRDLEVQSIIGLCQSQISFQFNSIPLYSLPPPLYPYLSFPLSMSQPTGASCPSIHWQHKGQIGPGVLCRKTCQTSNYPLFDLIPNILPPPPPPPLLGVLDLRIQGPSSTCASSNSYLFTGLRVFRYPGGIMYVNTSREIGNRLHQLGSWHVES